MLHGAPWQNLIPKAAYLTDRRFSGRKCSTMRVSTPSATPLVSEHAWSTYMHKVKVTENLHGTPACIQKVAPGLFTVESTNKMPGHSFQRNSFASSNWVIFSFLLPFPTRLRSNSESGILRHCFQGQKWGGGRFEDSWNWGGFGFWRNYSILNPRISQTLGPNRHLLQLIAHRKSVCKHTVGRTFGSQCQWFFWEYIWWRSSIIKDTQCI